jgi:hypothetical protein
MIVRQGEGEVFDADGERLESFIWADTESGEVMYLILDTPENDQITEIRVHSSPLEVRA